MLHMDATDTDVRQKVVASEVRAELARQQMSQRALARKMRRSDVYVSRRLRGEVPFSITDLDQVAAVLEVPVTKFLAGAA